MKWSQSITVHKTLPREPYGEITV